MQGVPEGVAQDLEITVLDAASRHDRTVFVINHASCDVAARFGVMWPSAERLGVRELSSLRSLPFSLHDGRVFFAGLVPARDAAIYHLYGLPAR